VQGRFTFDQVAPGDAWVTRRLPPPRDSITAAIAYVDAQPGKATRADLGGQGRPVVGRFALPPGSDLKVDWNFGRDTQFAADLAPARQALATFHRPGGWYGMTWEQRRAHHEAWDHTPAGLEQKRRGRGISFWVEPDGSFRIDDVVPGGYALSLALSQDDGGPTRFTDRVAHARRFLAVDPPAGAADPLDVGTITLMPLPYLKLNRPAPPLPIRSLDGGAVRLADYAGKFVLLVFWSDDRRPSAADIASIKQAHARHAEAGRLTILTVEFNDDPAAARRLARATGLEPLATHCVGKYSAVPLANLLTASIPEAYFQTPALFCLVDPDGKVAAKNLAADEIEGAIHRAIFAR
jgi:hypothetical protein